MKVYTLTFENGIESGYVQLIGIYESVEKVEETIEKHMCRSGDGRSHYRINEFELNEEIDITITEW